jgi:Glycoside hydrolase 123, N-terminal domain
MRIPGGCLRAVLPALFSIFLLPAGHLGQVEFQSGKGKWDADLYGNHRAVIRVPGRASAVWVHIPWRRRDLNPETKKVIFVDAATGRELRNICPVTVNREAGDFVFEPATAPGDYYVYYLPYVVKGRSNYPTVVYPEPAFEADPAWLQDFGLSPFRLPPKDRSAFAQAQVVEIQSIDELNAFFPMEVIATAEETAALLAEHPDAPYLLFPEDRRFPVRMADELPLRWVQSGPQSDLNGEAARGEFYAFQIGVFAARASIEDLDVQVSDLNLVADSPLPGRPSASILSSGAHSFNTRGVNWDGKDFKKACAIPRGKIQPLWCGVQVPEDIPPGRYQGEVIVKPKGFPPGRVGLVIDVQDGVLDDAGDSDLWRHSRLRWLDSRIAFDDDVVAPYTPLTVNGLTISCLGRSVDIGPDGLVAGIRSFFSPEVTEFCKEGRRLLASPIALAVDKGAGVLKWDGNGPRFVRQAPGVVAWEARSRAGALTLSCRAQMESDGFIEFKIELAAISAVEVDDIRLEIPLSGDAAKYMMGLGFKGGRRPPQFEWAWDQKNNQDALWIGDVNAGLQVSLRDENYSRPLNTNFYLSKPLNLPPSWWNQGKGRVTVKTTGDGVVLVAASSGPRRIEAGDILHFNFTLLLTPFKPIDPKAHFATRFFHAFKPVAEVAGTGANTINVHHANAVNPYINYPFLRPAEMKKYIDEAHARGMKVKIYYTIRELSNRCVELFALRSLGDEIFSKGPGGGFSWLQEHLVSNYIAAWFVPELKDAAIINSGMSRWHNYYLEGLNWLVRNVGIDGLYLDDVAFDRTTMKRIRKIVDRGRPGSLIDLHSANQYNPRDGFASSANLYLEHFPFLNRLWFGEYFDYNSAPDYWLVEISGIPFGLLGEMLEGGGNPWRGMIYGMTNRLPWSGQNPARIWKVWDEFGIKDARMIGYWSADCPVRTDNPDVLATAYVREGKTLISLASWAEQTVRCRLRVDWEALGLDRPGARLHAPEIPDFQAEADFEADDLIPVETGKGWLLELKSNHR